jgi:hypothetical protein
MHHWPPMLANTTDDGLELVSVGDESRGYRPAARDLGYSVSYGQLMIRMEAEWTVLPIPKIPTRYGPARHATLTPLANGVLCEPSCPTSEPVGRYVALVLRRPFSSRAS